MFNKWLLFLFIHLHSPPYYHLFFTHVVPWRSPFRRCSILHFHQVEVQLLTCPIIHPAVFLFVWSIELWIESRRAPRKHLAKRSSCRAWIVTCSLRFRSPFAVIPFLARTHGMVSFNYCIGILHFCRTALGSFGEFYLSKQLPGPSLFVVPYFPLGILAIPVRSVAHFPWCLPSSPLCVISPSKGACDWTLPAS